MTGFCLGIAEENADKREQRRSRLSKQVREIMKQILDARSVLNEEPPTKPTETTVPFTNGDTPADLLTRGKKARPSKHCSPQTFAKEE